MQTEFRQPAEWEAHESVWLAWPSHENLWKEDLRSAQEEFTAFCEAIVNIDPATGTAKGERLNVLVPNREAGAMAAVALGRLPVRFHEIPFGDIWLRDTAPVFLRNAKGERSCARFVFNGWGGKYNLPHDPEVAERIANATQVPGIFYPFVLEGGSVDVDGEGTCLTTRQCLLNKNRNPGFSEMDIELGLKEAFGLKKVLWLKDGLRNDHTDGHIDNIARFVAPGVVVCMEAKSANDPNAEVLRAIAHDLEQMQDACGRKLRVVRVPSPGLVLDFEERIMPASYLNFYIANTTVVVPIYGTPFDRAAVEVIGAWFPGRKALGLPAKTILAGGGAFHCISQQQPL